MKRFRFNLNQVELPNLNLDLPGKIDGIWDALSNNRLGILCALLLAYLYFRGIGDHGLIDPVEGVNASVSLSMLADGSWFRPHIGEVACAGRSFGAWWLSAISLVMFGWREIAVRFWSVLAGLGTIWIAAKATLSMKQIEWGWNQEFTQEQFLPERRAREPWLATAICASMTFCFAVSQIASSHALYMFFTGLAMLAFCRVLISRKWAVVAHCATLAAFIVHGPEGLILPWLTLWLYCMITDNFDMFYAAVYWWPADLITVLGVLLYLVFFAFGNPMSLFFMTCRAPDFLELGFFQNLLLILTVFVPWTGFVFRAILTAIPHKREMLQSSDAPNFNFFLAFWVLLFGFMAILMRDPLSLATCVPAAAALVARALDKWAREGLIKQIQFAVAWNILLTLPLLAVLFFLGHWIFPLLRGSLFSFVPWAIFVLLTLFVAWRCTRTKQILKLLRNTTIVALLCLLPLAGIFNLAAERNSPREVGLALRRTLKPEDVLVQYGTNHPSLYFYTMRNYSLVNGRSLRGVAMKQLAMNDTALQLLWTRKERTFLVMYQHERPTAPMPMEVYNLMDANSTRANNFAILSNHEVDLGVY